VVRELTLLWPAFESADAERFWPTLRLAIRALVNSRRRTSSGLASAYYSQFRAAENVLGRTEIKLAPDLPQPLVDTTLDFAGLVEFKKALRRGRTKEQATARSLVTTAGAASRLVLDGGRSTIDATVNEDVQALGYLRVTDNDPCAFCAMLASRGPAYRSKESAAGATPDHYHDHCGCTAEPMYDHDTNWPGRAKEFQDLWVESTSGEHGHNAVKAFRRAYEAQQRVPAEQS
jgi:hypothetical protein